MSWKERGLSLDRDSDRARNLAFICWSTGNENTYMLRRNQRLRVGTVVCYVLLHSRKPPSFCNVNILLA